MSFCHAPAENLDRATKNVSRVKLSRKREMKAAKRFAPFSG
jgi:hypothetical protein